MAKIVDRNSRPSSVKAYSLDSDAYAGFSTSVERGQTRLALEYAVHIIEDLTNRIENLEGRPNVVNNNSGLGLEETAKLVDQAIESHNRDKHSRGPAKKADAEVVD